MSVQLTFDNYTMSINMTTVNKTITNGIVCLCLFVLLAYWFFFVTVKRALMIHIGTEVHLNMSVIVGFVSMSILVSIATSA